MTTPDMKAANCEHEYDRPGKSGTPLTAHHQLEAACPMHEEYLSARDIEAIVMCGRHIDTVAPRIGPGGRPDRSTIVEKWAANVKRLLDFGR
jgi:hypothetical protein